MPELKPSHLNERLARRDLAAIWHPCTQMKDHEWLPMIPIRSGSGVWLEDFAGHRYLDAISSWWVNLFGHANPRINAALRAQLERLEHVIFAGFTHEPAIELAESLMRVAPAGLTKCFFADNGSAAVEVAIKMSFHYWRNVGRTTKTRFVTLSGSYHGETLGALAVGNVELYRDIYRPLLMDVLTAPSPDCYSCEPGESWEAHSLGKLRDLEKLLERHAREIAGVIVEPLVQCAAGMRMYHPGYLKGLRTLCDRFEVHLIADEIAVGFGRTGTMFACEQENVSPDFLCVAKSLTGGYMPLAATLATERIYKAFLGRYDEFKTFFHGHTYTANPLACAVALANLELYKKEGLLKNVRDRAEELRRGLETLSSHPHVKEIRQVGLMVGIELVQNRRTGKPFDPERRMGLKVCDEAIRRGVWLRPLADVVVLMPPLAITKKELAFLIDVVRNSVILALG